MLNNSAPQFLQFMDNHVTFHDIPQEILIHICVWLPIRDLLEFSLINKNMSRFIRDNYTFLLKCRRNGWSPLKRKRIGSGHHYWTTVLRHQKRKMSIPRLSHFGEAEWKMHFRENYIIQNVNWKSGRFVSFLADLLADTDYHLYLDDDKAASASTTNLNLWDFYTGDKLMQLASPQQVSCLKFDHQYVLVGFSNGMLAIYSALNGSMLASIQAHSTRISSVAIGVDVVASGCDNGIISIYKFDGSLTLFTSFYIHSSNVTSLQWQNSSLISTGMDGKIVKWSSNSCQITSQDGGAIFCMQTSNEWIVVGCEDGIVRIFDFETGRLVSRLVGHVNAVVSIHFDNLRLVSGGVDRTIKVWEFRNLNLETNPTVSLSPKELSGKVLTALRTNRAKTQIIASVFDPQTQRENILILDFSVETW